MNYLPQMTKRVLSTQKVVLCKSPIANVEEVQQTSASAMKVHSQLAEFIDSPKHSQAGANTPKKI